MRSIRYPEMRKELVHYLHALADHEYQIRVWVNGERNASVRHDEFDYAVHFLFDDTQLAKSPSATIGWILRNESEAEQVAVLVKEIEAIFAKYGTGLSDAEYIDLPEWDLVIRAATTAAKHVG